MEIEKLIERLKDFEACAYGYNINGEVLGMDCSDFEQIMVDAADSISTLQAENAKLRAELTREAEARKKQADILCELRAQKYEQISVIGKLRAEWEKYQPKEHWETLNELCANLHDELEKVKEERDAAVSDLETIMAYGGGNMDTCQFCKNGQCYQRGGTKPCLPEWRGQKED